MQQPASSTPQAGRILTQDLKAGLTFIGIAALFGWEARNYELGQAVRMGPGFIPVVLCTLLGAMGAIVALSGLGPRDEPASSPLAWRGIFLITLTLVIFGAYSRQLGLVPVVFICVLIVALASVRNSVASALGLAAALAILCWLVFKIGLGVTLPAIGPIFGPLAVY